MKKFVLLGLALFLLGCTQLSKEKIKAEKEIIERINNLEGCKGINPLDYPKTIGQYNGKTIVEVYYCSDVCPKNGRVYLIYQGVEEEECKDIGKPIYDYAWHSYVGCEPIID